MMELKDVCKSLLDNADMQIDFSAYPKARLEIYVQGTVNGKHWKVEFECGQIVYMEAEFDDDSSSEDMFVVLDANVTELTKKKVAPAIQHRIEALDDDDVVWKVDLYGDMSLSLVTTKFNWCLIELTKKEYEAAYA